MAEKKRQCGTCRFFAKDDTDSHGKCTHPKRDKALREMTLLRPNELGCRTRWGTSLWQSHADDSDPLSPETPQQPTLPEPIPAQLHYDDEVTSVSIAGSKSARPSFEDDVVDSGATGSGLGSWSDTEQEERRRLLMSGERDALAGARKRHMEKQALQRELVPFAEEDPENNNSEKPENTSDDQEESVAASKSDFPPDDYVEDERSSNKDEPIADDEMVDDGVSPGHYRSPRVKKLLRDNKSPKNHKAMGLGTPAEMAVTSNNPDQREQWNSVPSMTPGFELPLVGSQNATPSPSTPLRVSASAAPMAMNVNPSRPVSQARELVTEDRLRGERARRHVSVPMLDDFEENEPEETPQPSVTNRPRLNQAPPQRAAPVERLKTSPLRGYHPAVKAAAARAEENQAAERQPVRQQPERQRAPMSQSQPAPKPFTSNWQPQAKPEVEQAPVREEVRPNLHTEQVGQQERRRDPRTYLEEAPASALRTRQELEPRRAPREQEYEEFAAHETQQARDPEPRNSPRQQPNRKYIPLQHVQQDTPFTRIEIAISPEVPSCCGTCSSFIPSDKDGRGSCSNAFAGPENRVVYENDLACQHTYGSFWLPADEIVWLKELNEIYPPTPRVDAMIARRRRNQPVVLPDLDELTS